MIWKLLLVAINFFAEGGFTGEQFDYNPLELNEESLSCQRRMHAAVARVEVGEPRDGSSPFSRGICGADIQSSFLGDRNSAGTGYLVSLNPPILLTNRHNLRLPINSKLIEDKPANNQDPCRSGLVNFNFTGLNQRVGCKRVRFAFDSEFGTDAVFVELERLPEGANFLRLNDENTLSEPVNFVGHPAGSNAISYHSCNITSGYEHTCPSTTGSSGSPLVDSNCQVVGMHFAGSLEPSCSQNGIYFPSRSCSSYPRISDDCRNTFNQSSRLASVLPLILEERLVVRDEEAAFDDKERYTLLPERTPAEDSTRRGSSRTVQ